MRSGSLYGPVPPRNPARIVSLVPSLTELLHALGLEAEVAGITRFCIHPGHWFRNKVRVGGTKKVHLDLVEALAPDLVLANREENVREQVEGLAEKFPVYVSDIRDMAGALDMIADVGELTGHAMDAEKLVSAIRDVFALVSPLNPPLKTAYLIWQEPFMAAGGDTFINAMMQVCGLENIFANRLRYPVTTLEELAALNPALVLLSSEPFPFRETHLAQMREALPGTRVMLADGEMFSWYGSRLLHAGPYFCEMLQTLKTVGID